MKIILTESQLKTILEGELNTKMGDTNKSNKSIEDDIKDFIQRGLIRVKTENKYFLDKSKKILNPYLIIDDFQNYLISKIPEAIIQMKSGNGGNKFAYDCFLYVKNKISQEMDDMDGIKKGAIRLMAGSKETVMKNMKDVDFQEYIFMFEQILDFSMPIALRDDFQKYENNSYKWYKDMTNWVTKNQSVIKNDIINLMVTKLYS
jgi:hypothetical protein